MITGTPSSANQPTPSGDPPATNRPPLRRAICGEPSATKNLYSGISWSPDDDQIKLGVGMLPQGQFKKFYGITS
ncbi:hypothetical protein R6Q59_025872 [Mikania micrantha]